MITTYKKLLLPIAIASALTACGDARKNSDSNGQPIINDIPNIIVMANSGAMVDYAVKATDPDGDDLSFSLQDHPDWVSINVETGVITINSLQAVEGVHSFYLIVSDGVISVKKVVRLEITSYEPNPSNPSPEFSPLEDSYSVVEFVESQIQVIATDIDENSDQYTELTFQLINSPQWAKIDHVTGLITALAEDNTTGEHPFTVLVSDGNTSTTVTSKFVVTDGEDPDHETPDIENSAPSVDTIPNISVRINEVATHRVLANDKDGDLLSYSINSNEDWVSIDQKGLIVAKPLTEHEGNYSFVVTVTDGKVDVNKAFDLKVGIKSTPIVPPAPNQKPILFDIPQLSVKQGESISYRVRAIDEDKDKLTFSVSGESWVTIDPNVGVLLIDAPEDVLGESTFTVTVSDGQSEVSKTVTIDVSSSTTFNVSTDVTNGGNVTPRNKNVSSGESLTLKLEPYENYIIDTVNGCDGSLNGNSYVIDSVSDNCVVDVDFKLKSLNAVDNEDHTLATDVQLIGLIKNELSEQKAKQRELMSILYKDVDSVSFNINHDGMMFEVSGLIDGAIPFLYHNTDYRAAYGVMTESENGTKFAALATNPFAYSIDDGMVKLLKNMFNYMADIDFDNLDRPIKIVTANMENTGYFRFHNNIYDWFNNNAHEGFEINDYASCDGANLAMCVEERQPDLVFVGDRASTEYSALKSSLITIKEQKTPVIYVALKHSEFKRNILGDFFGSYAHDGGSSLSGLTMADVNQSYDLYVSDQVTLLDRFISGDFDTTSNEGCPGNLLYCGTDSYNNHFRNGAKSFGSLAEVIDIQKKDIFETQGNSAAKAALLLGDKYRSTVDYPVSKSTPKKYFQALFSDFLVSYARKRNLAQPDLGEYVQDIADVSLGENSHYAYPSTISETKEVSVSYGNQWTSTGWYALPSKTIKLSRLDDGDNDVWIKLHYALNNTNRDFERDFLSKPQGLTTERFYLKSGESIEFSTPYGAPIYLNIKGDGSQRESVTIKAENVAQHPTILGFTADEISEFEEVMSSTEMPHIDLVSEGYEIHLRRNRFETPANETYGSVTEMLNAIQEIHIGNAYGLSAFKMQGYTLEESVPSDAMAVCIAKFGRNDCVDETIHTRGIIQHATIDQHANCGVGCGGNPWSSSYDFTAHGWLENHELGHNLQTKRLNAHYATEENKEQWRHYGNRSGENSNNIFPYTALWYENYIYSERETPVIDGHMNHKDMFFAIMSDKLNLQHNGSPVSYDSACEIDPDNNGTLEEAIWSHGGYVPQNGQRMFFYIQMALRAHGETMSNGTVLKNGFDIYPMLYQHERIFGKYASNEELWEANKARLGFGLFDYNSTAGQPHEIVGNDFMLVSLSYLTGKNWTPYFEMVGLRNTTLAKQQAIAHGTTDGVVDSVPVGMYVLEQDLPPQTMSDTLTWIDLSTANEETVWSRDNSTPLNCQAE